MLHIFNNFLSIQSFIQSYIKYNDYGNNIKNNTAILALVNISTYTFYIISQEELEMNKLAIWLIIKQTFYRISGKRQGRFSRLERARYFNSTLVINQLQNQVIKQVVSCPLFVIKYTQCLQNTISSNSLQLRQNFKGFQLKSVK